MSSYDRNVDAKEIIIITSLSHGCNVPHTDGIFCIVDTIKSWQMFVSYIAWYKYMKYISWQNQCIGFELFERKGMAMKFY